MMRALWTGASGMIAQQTNVDTIGNNLANVNTTGYKTQQAEFKSLLYQTIQSKSTDSEGMEKPLGIQVGLGVKNSAISTKFTQGPLLETGDQFDFAIEGEGFFLTRLEDGSIAYTRNGNLTMAIGADGYTLTNGDGNPILDSDLNPIIVPGEMPEELNPGGEPKRVELADVAIDAHGNVTIKDGTNNQRTIGVQIGLAVFNNPSGLNKIGNSNFKPTAASGEPRYTNAAALGTTLVNGRLEGSNVQVVDEMVNLIVAQRAYEFNSKVINASDEMLQQANNLRS